MLKHLILFIALTLSTYAVKGQTENLALYGTYQDSYPFELLKHALAYLPNKQYQLISFNEKLPKDRAFDFMNDHIQVDIIFGGSTIQREEKALPIRIPILKGLNGWRVPLVNKDVPALFLAIDSMAKFKQLVPGQYHSWSDTKVLESNGIRVEKGSDFEGLFLMLDKARFDYFPRSVLEVYQEYETRKQLNIAIDSSVLLHYPTAYYFYVAKDNQALADDITYGLEQAIADGSFERIFVQHHHEIINKINKMHRKVFSLNNPYLPEKTPLERPELWFSLRPETEIIR